ncbi:MAG: hypothetical protein N2449_05865 [Bacteroidales bacterium]|nr:hypothetical protein [Bacteroidales bacterium]
MLEYLRDFIVKLGQTIISIVRILFLTRFIPSIKKENNHSECLILTNGPSLNTSIENNLQFTTDKILFCVNFFPNTPYYEQLKPRYHVISAPELWLPQAKHPYPKLSEELFNNIAQKTTWKLTILIPFAAKKYTQWREKLVQNSNVEIEYYNPTPIEGFRWFCHAMYHMQWGMPRPHNVLIPSLMLAMKKGFKSIYIWGADHSWLKEISVDEQNQVLVNQKHFYDENTAKPQPMNKLKGTRKLHEVLIKFVHAFKGYWEIEEYAKQKNITIWNATPHSFIDAFKRYKMNE